MVSPFSTLPPSQFPLLFLIVFPVNFCSHGAESELVRKVITESPTSTRGVVELRPPTIVITQITSSKPMTSLSFNFSGGSSSSLHTVKATSITLSKADPVSLLKEKIRDLLHLPSSSEIRCYKFLPSRSEYIASEMTAQQVLKVIVDKEDSLLDLSTEDATIGEIGIVEPYVGIAAEYKSITGQFPMDQEPSPSASESSIQGTTTTNSSSSAMSSDVPTGVGRTLGASPNAFTALNKRTPDRQDKSIFDVDDEENAGLGKINGQVVMGPSLPGAYPKTSPVNSTSSNSAYLRSSSEERYGERNRNSFNSRFASGSVQVHEKERVRGTTGLNNLGIHTLHNCVSGMGADFRKHLLHEFCFTMSCSLQGVNGILPCASVQI